LLITFFIQRFRRLNKFFFHVFSRPY